MPRSAPRPSYVGLPVAYHFQQDPDWCDPADLEMWLASMHVALPGSGDYAIQHAFWNYELSHNDGYSLVQWNASPYAVAATFDHFAGNGAVGDAPLPSLAAAGLVISQSIGVRHQPVIALVDGGSHYILLSGVVLGPQGASAPPLAVTVQDPWAYGAVRGGYPAMGHGVTLSWSEFGNRLTANPRPQGIWRGKWVLIATGLRLAG